METHLIDLSIDSHEPATNGFEYVLKDMSVYEGMLEFNPACLKPYQGCNGTFAEVREYLLSQGVTLLNGSVLDFLLAHPEKISDVVKSDPPLGPCDCDQFCMCEIPTHRRFFFLGTVYQSKSTSIKDLRFVRYLHHDWDGWHEGKCRFDEMMRDDFIATYEDWSENNARLYDGERLMVAFDVAYAADAAYGVAVGFRDWSDATPLFIEHVRRPYALGEFEDIRYIPGEFWRRELPILQMLIERTQKYSGFRIYLVDAYAWLDPFGRRALGAILWQEVMKRQGVVIGVAKNEYKVADNLGYKVFPHTECERVQRCGSKKPLFVTAAGADPRVAAKAIQNMHGPHRHPTLIKWADTGTRDLVAGRSDFLNF